MKGYATVLVVTLGFLLSVVLHAQGTDAAEGAVVVTRAAGREAAIHDELRVLRGVFADSIQDSIWLPR